MKGIMFKEDLFHKVIDGTKTETRMICTNDKHHLFGWEHKEIFYFENLQTGEPVYFKPKYKVGEIVYLKEPYRLHDAFKIVDYKYSFDNGAFEYNFYDWKNKMFMPEKYARYFIEIEDVRCELLKEITALSAILEGCKHIDDYIELWDQINPKTPFSDCPYVWVYTFKLVKP